VLATAGCSTGIRIFGATIETGAAATGALTTLWPWTRVEAAGCDASILLVGVFTTATGELILDDDFRAVPGSTLFSVTGGPASGCAVPAAGATAGRSAAEVIARDCEPPLLCTTPLRGSSLAVDPIEVVPVMLVELVVDDVEVDPPRGCCSTVVHPTQQDRSMRRPLTRTD
jgi:hypothetical protein